MPPFDHDHVYADLLERSPLRPARLCQPPSVIAEAVRHSGRFDAGRDVVLAHGIGMPDRIADSVQGVRSNSGKFPGSGTIE
jgi:hypothetical protein